MDTNGKNFQRNFAKGLPKTRTVTMADPGKPEDRFFSIYHPTKGWRRVSLKRGVAQSIVSGRVFLRGHAIARIIAHGY